MDPTTERLMGGAAGAAGDEKVYVEDVFNTTVFKANGSTGQSFVTGLDLDPVSGKGGMVWHKDREVTYSHSIWDTERGTSSVLSSNSSADETTYSNSITFNSDGHSVTGAQGNESTDKTVAWSFCKAPGFFDVVTYNGNTSSTQEVSHNLGCIPGMIIVKNYTATGYSWAVYAKHGQTSTYNARLLFNDAGARDNLTTTDWSTTPADFNKDSFTVGSGDLTNMDGQSHVAYLFADGADADAQIFGDNGDEPIIKCGGYTGAGGNGTIKDVDLGWEPQFVLIKCTSTSNTSWRIFNNMGGWIAGTGYDSKSLKPNTNDIEGTSHRCYITPTGFRFVDEGAKEVNAQASDNDTYIYMAIRRGQMKTPEDATKVFKTITYAGSNNPQTISGVGFAPDWMWSKDYDNGYDGWLFDRIRGIRQFGTDADREEQAEPSYVDYLNSDGVYLPAGGSTVNRNGSNHAAQFLKRAPGFFDIVTYDGDGQTNRQITHNLNAKPELMIVKQRDASRSWAVYASSEAGMGTGKFLKLDTDDYKTTQTGVFDTAPTPSIFTVEDNTYVNINGGYYIAYLFASLSGISKVGTYDGIGNTAKDITCDGFTSGARFILIKRIDDSGTGNWGVWDSVRGISSTGDDPYLRFDVVNSQMNFNDISPLNTGFTVNSNNDTGGTGASGNWNINGATYIYLAIA